MKNKLHFLFEQYVNSHPNKVALIFGDKKLTYLELNQKANQLARKLIEQGVNPGDRVGICLERSFDLIASVLAVLKAGASYLPLDPEYPKDRLEYMIGHAKPKVLIHHKKLLNSLPKLGSGALCFDELRLDSFETENLNISEGSLCYIIYTSGSTGTPKGVAMGHKALYNLIEWQNKQSSTLASPVTLQFTPISFDVHFQEIFSTLTMGGTLVLVSEEERLDSLKLLDIIASKKVERLFLPFVALNHLSEMAQHYNKIPKFLKEVTTAGEQLKITEGIRYLFSKLEGARLHNHYGPSETHVVTSYTLEGDPNDWEDLPSIGKPISNVTCYFLDENLNKTSGEGELYFGGECLAEGYLFQEELTRERFINTKEFGRLYKTGDLGKLNKNQDIDFLGRLDGQVKIRGYRIETGEIEVCMQKLEGVDEAAIKVFEEGTEKYLVGYITGNEKPLEVKNKISESLPDYMIPSHIISLASMPLTPSGKVDKKSLPKPGNERPELNIEFLAPSSEKEKILASLWGRHLKIEKVGVQDSFFDLGGNSLLALRILAELKEKYQINISVVKMFQYPTIEAQVASLDGDDDSELKNRLKTFKKKQSRENKDIAVIAMNGRFPGADSVEKLWENLLEGVNSITPIPKEQLDQSISEELKNDPNYVSARGIMPEFDKFDSSFFGMTPREAELMDPQQRVFLELAYESLEKSGYTSQKYDGSIGVFAGMANNTYYQKVLKQTDKVNSVGEFNVMLGNEKDYIATRVSHKLNLKGPSLSLHTGCSTSLVAIIQAVQSLRNGECDMALAGGISIQGAPYSGYLYQEGGIFSKDGKCRPFDSEASGTVFNDGGALVVLKPLEEAIKDGDEIHGVIKGVALNNDGADKMSFTAPSVNGQAEAIARAHIDGAVDAKDIRYIEAHGTATPVGDPVEVEGLCKAFGEIDKKEFCALGSIKSNIGHLTSAAGVTGFIKSLLVAKTGVVPGTLHFRKANGAIDFSKTPFIVSSKNLEIKDDKKRVTGVSSFGVGGTNAHIVLENYQEEENADPIHEVNLYRLSAKSKEALEELSKKQIGLINSLSLKDKTRAAYTLDVGRFDYAFRQIIVGGNEELKKLGPSNSAKDKFKNKKKLYFMFPGQGSQYINMGSGLMKYKAFKESFDRCCDILAKHQDRDLREIIFPEKDNEETAYEALKNTYYTQPAIFCFEYSLANLLMSWGLTPDGLIGHSVGEFVAATLSGIFTLEEGLALIAKRGELMKSLPGGSMLSVRLGEEEVTPFLNDDIQLAAVNAPGLVVVAGPADKIKLFQESLEKRDIVCRFLHTSHAFHSAMMDPIVPKYEDFVKSFNLREAQIPIFSTVEKNADLSQSSYWANHLRAPVKFSPCIEVLAMKEDAIYLEIGPRNTLATLSKKVFLNCERKDLVSIQTISDSPELEERTLLKAIGQLWLHGTPIDSDLFYGNKKPKRMALETMPFKRRRTWIDETTTYIEEINIEKEKKMTATNDGLRSKLTEVFEDASGMDISEFDSDTSFMEMGMDSLFLTQVALNLKKTFKVEIGFRQLMEELATVNELCSFLKENSEVSFDQEAPAPAPAPVAEPAPVQAPAPAPVVAAAPVQPIAQAAPVQLSSGSNLETIVAKQLDLMSQQMQLLSGQAVVSAPAALVPQATVETAAPVATPAPAQESKPAAKESKKVEVNNAKKAFGAIARINTQKNTELTAEQVSYIDQLTSEYNKKTKGSKEFTQKYRKSHADPRVVTGFRPEVKELIYPLVINKSHNQTLWDIDGNEYIDMLCGFGSNFFGNGNEKIKKYVLEQIENGYEIGPQHELTGEVSRLVCELTNSDRAGFCNTGSEAVLGAMRVARTVTGRDTIIAFEGSYHGINDEVIVRGTKSGKSLPAAPGINKDSVKNMIILEYGTEESLEKIRELSKDAAAVLVEPVQSRRSDFHPKEFLQEVRKITLENDCALIFDEVITGFRIHPGGAQAYFDVKADLATYGKIVGGGISIGIIAGKEKYMDALDGGHWEFGDASTPTVGVTYFAGTFVRHPMALAAAKGALEIIKEGGVKQLQDLTEKADHFADELNLYFQQVGLPLKMDNFGSLMKPKWKEEVQNGDLLFTLMRYYGVHCYDGFPWFVNLAHTDEELQTVISIFKKSVRALQKVGLLPGIAGSEPKFDIPPMDGAILGKDALGNPAWFIKDPDNPDEYLEIEA